MAPGAVAAEGGAEFTDPNGDFAKSYIAGSKLGRTGTPDDVAPAVVFLASEDAKWITGETLVISGGFR